MFIGDNAGLDRPFENAGLPSTTFWSGSDKYGVKNSENCNDFSGAGFSRIGHAHYYNVNFWLNYSHTDC